MPSKTIEKLKRNIKIDRFFSIFFLIIYFIASLGEIIYFNFYEPYDLRSIFHLLIIIYLAISLFYFEISRQNNKIMLMILQKGDEKCSVINNINN